MMCMLLRASRAGYYAWRDHKPSEHEKEDAQLATQIRVVHKQSHETCGSLRQEFTLSFDTIVRVSKLSGSHELCARKALAFAYGVGIVRRPIRGTGVRARRTF